MSRPPFCPIARQFFQTRWLRPRVFSPEEAWIDCIQMARYAGGEYKNGATLTRGQFAASYSWLATRWGWSVKQVRVWITRAQSRADLRAEQRAEQRAQSPTIYSLVAYEHWNGKDGDEGTADGMAQGTDQGTVEGTNIRKERRVVRRKNISESPVFLEAWALYPKRPNNNRAEAWEAWSARLKAGESESAMLDGTRAYLAWVVGTGTEPKYVKQAATFYGPKRHYLNDYTIPATELSLIQGGQVNEERYAFLVGEAQRGMDMGDTAKYPDWPTYRARYWRGEKPKTNRGALRSAG